MSKAFLPVQGLRDHIISYVLDVKEIAEALENECDTNDLSRSFMFWEERDRIKVAAAIIPVDKEYQICLSLTFAQYLWSVGLYLINYFDNCVQIPMMNAVGLNIHNYQPDLDAVSYAEEQFFLARQLTRTVCRESFFYTYNILNPGPYKDIIEHANGAMLGATLFLFTHELAHNYLGHTHILNTYARSVADEKAADHVAMDFIESTFDGPNGTTNKIGIALLFSSLLLMGEDSISGSGTHPHIDVRIAYIVDRLQLDPMDNIYGLIGSAIRLWLLVYGGLTLQEDMASGPFTYYKDFYDHYLSLLTSTRQRRYPDLVPPAWEV